MNYRLQNLSVTIVPIMCKYKKIKYALQVFRAIDFKCKQLKITDYPPHPDFGSPNLTSTENAVGSCTDVYISIQWQKLRLNYNHSMSYFSLEIRI